MKTALVATASGDTGRPAVARLLEKGFPVRALMRKDDERAEFVEIGNLAARRLSELISKVTTNRNYRDKAGWFQKILAETPGLDMAADIIERVFGEHLEALKSGEFISG